jgi:mRNA interferase MazF
MQEPLIEQARRFVDWASQMIGLHFRKRGRPYFQEREVWWASLGENIGSEINGKNHRFERPIIIVKKFCNDMMLIVPSTTKLKSGSWYFSYQFEGKELCAALAQLRVISVRRLIRKMGNIDPVTFSELKKALVLLIGGK